MFIPSQKLRTLRALLAWVIIVTFTTSMVTPVPQASAQNIPLLNLPLPGTMVNLSPVFSPALLKGLKVHPENPFQFDFIVDTGNTNLKEEALKKESTKLVKYFLASLTIPEEDLWVNLSPYEKDRIIPGEFGTTEMGRDMLAQDYILKQLTASLMYPEKELGKGFWQKVYQKTRERYGTTEIPINTFNKVWIVPEKAVVYENGGTAFVTQSRLKVMLEGDYLALEKNFNKEDIGTDQLPSQDVEHLSDVSSQIVREIILPEIEKEVNEGENFAQLRQIYNSLILAAWFKRGLKESILSQVYVDKNKTAGVDVDKSVKEKIYAQYLEAFKKGVYDYVKEEYDPATKEIIPRKYFAGGMQFGDRLKDALVIDKDPSAVKRWASKIIMGAAMLLSVNLVEPGSAPAAELNQITPAQTSTESQQASDVQKRFESLKEYALVNGEPWAIVALGQRAFSSDDPIRKSFMTFNCVSLINQASHGDLVAIDALKILVKNGNKSALEGLILVFQKIDYSSRYLLEQVIDSLSELAPDHPEASEALFNLISQKDRTKAELARRALSLEVNLNPSVVDALTKLLSAGRKDVADFFLEQADSHVLDLRKAHLEDRISNEELKRKLAIEHSARNHPFLLYVYYTSRENFGDLARMIMEELTSQAKSKGMDLHSFLKELDPQGAFYKDFILQAANFSMLDDLLPSEEALQEVMNLLFQGLSTEDIKNYDVRLALFIENITQDKSFGFQQEAQEYLRKLYDQTEGLNQYFIAALLSVYKNNLGFLNNGDITEIARRHNLEETAADKVAYERLFVDSKLTAHLVFADEDAVEGHYQPTSEFFQMKGRDYKLISSTENQIILEKGNIRVVLIKADEEDYNINEHLSEVGIVSSRSHAGNEGAVFGDLETPIDSQGKIFLISSCRSATTIGGFSSTYPGGEFIGINGIAEGEKTNILTYYLLEALAKGMPTYEGIGQFIRKGLSQGGTEGNYATIPGDRSLIVDRIIKEDISVQDQDAPSDTQGQPTETDSTSSPAETNLNTPQSPVEAGAVSADSAALGQSQRLTGFKRWLTMLGISLGFLSNSAINPAKAADQAFLTPQPTAAVMVDPVTHQPIPGVQESTVIDTSMDSEIRNIIAEAETSLARDDFNEGRKTIEKALETHPQMGNNPQIKNIYARLYLQRGAAMEKIGRYGEAGWSYADALGYDPSLASQLSAEQLENAELGRERKTYNDALLVNGGLRDNQEFRDKMALADLKSARWLLSRGYEKDAARHFYDATYKSSQAVRNQLSPEETELAKSAAPASPLTIILPLLSLFPVVAGVFYLIEKIKYLIDKRKAKQADALMAEIRNETDEKKVVELAVRLIKLYPRDKWELMSKIEGTLKSALDTGGYSFERYQGVIKHFEGRVRRLPYPILRLLISERTLYWGSHEKLIQEIIKVLLGDFLDSRYGNEPLGLLLRTFDDDLPLKFIVTQLNKIKKRHLRGKNILSVLKTLDNSRENSRDKDKIFAKAAGMILARRGDDPSARSDWMDLLVNFQSGAGQYAEFHPDPVPLLREILTAPDSNSQLVTRAIKTSDYLGSRAQEMVPEIIQRFSLEASPELQKTIFQALASIGSDPAMRFIVTNGLQGSKELRIAALDVLEEAPSSHLASVVQDLIYIINEPYVGVENDKAMSLAIVALGQSRDPRALPYLRANVRSNFTESAILGLRKFGAVDDLAAIVMEPDFSESSVKKRERAMVALVETAGYEKRVVFFNILKGLLAQDADKTTDNLINRALRGYIRWSLDSQERSREFAEFARGLNPRELAGFRSHAGTYFRHYDFEELAELFPDTFQAAPEAMRALLGPRGSLRSDALKAGVEISALLNSAETARTLAGMLNPEGVLVKEYGKKSVEAGVEAFLGRARLKNPELSSDALEFQQQFTQSLADLKGIAGDNQSWQKRLWQSTNLVGALFLAPSAERDQFVQELRQARALEIVQNNPDLINSDKLRNGLDMDQGISKLFNPLTILSQWDEIAKALKKTALGAGRPLSPQQAEYLALEIHKFHEREVRSEITAEAINAYAQVAGLYREVSDDTGTEEEKDFRRLFYVQAYVTYYKNRGEQPNVELITGAIARVQDLRDGMNTLRTSTWGRNKANGAILLAVARNVMAQDNRVEAALAAVGRVGSMIELLATGSFLSAEAVGNILASEITLRALLSGSLDGTITRNKKNVRRFLEEAFAQDYASYQDDIRVVFLQNLPEGMIARILGINIKLARYLKKKAQNYQTARKILERLLKSNPVYDFKARINEIAYNLNREVTVHHTAKRVGDDEKDSLFDKLFELDDLTEAKNIFDQYFRNSPEQYEIPISDLNQVLEYLSIEQVEGVIRSLEDDPKASLDEVIKTVKEKTEGRADADIILKKVEWTLSNLSVLQQKIDQLRPLARAFVQTGKTTEDLRTLLEGIDKAKKFLELNNIAEANGLNIMDVLIFKLESITIEAREELLIDTFEQIHTLPDIQQRQDLFSELTRQFEYQSAQSQMRLYMGLLFAQTTNNAAITTTIAELKEDREISSNEFKKPWVKRFLFEQRRVLAENQLLAQYLEEAAILAQNEQKEPLKQLRKLYQDRTYTAKKLPANIQGLISALAQQIALPVQQAQVPHVFFEPLLSINPGNTALETLRSLIAAMQSNPAMHDSLATSQNMLYDKIAYFLQVISVSQKAPVMATLLEELVKQYGPPSSANVGAFYQDLIYCLEKYAKAGDTLRKAAARGFPPLINDTLLELSRIVIYDLISKQQINRDKIDELAERLASMDAETLMARFSKTDEESLQKLKLYAAHNPRFGWRDYQGRNIYQLIDIFLTGVSDPEIYRNLWDGLMAEIDGNFEQWKYRSQDYTVTIDEIIKIEVAKLGKDKQEEFQEAIGKAEGETLYEKLQNIAGFDGLKTNIEKIRNWEKALRYLTEDSETVEVSDDFYTLFNIGNYRGTTACQRADYPGPSLRRGLAGYVANGTNRAVVLLDSQRNVVTRRIIRLKIVEDEQGNRKPVIFVEESTQFGSRDIDKLYGLLDILSQKTGLPVIRGQHRPAETQKVQTGERKNFRIELYAGREPFDYSDTYGHLVDGATGDGRLYKQTDPKVVTNQFLVLVVMPAATKTEEDIAAEYGLTKIASEKTKAQGVLEESFDLRVLRFNEYADPLDVHSAEEDTAIHMVKVANPSPGQVKALTQQGYFLRPAKVVYELDLPTGVTVEDGMNIYYGRFDSKKKRQFKRDVSDIDDAIQRGEVEVVEDTGAGMDDFAKFTELYQEEMGAKARGRTPLLDQIEKEGSSQNFMRNDRIGVYIKAKDGRIIGGIIAKKFSNRYSISFAATKKNEGIRSMQFYLMQYMIRKSINQGYEKLGYGVDTNLYGHHLSAGLMQAKVNSGFRAAKAGTETELVKIINFGVFDLPVFLYNFDPSGEQLESTLIITDNMVDRIKEFKNVTPILNIYILRDGKLVKMTVESQGDSAALGDEADYRDAAHIEDQGIVSGGDQDSPDTREVLRTAPRPEDPRVGDLRHDFDNYMTTVMGTLGLCQLWIERGKILDPEGQLKAMLIHLNNLYNEYYQIRYSINTWTGFIEKMEDIKAQLLKIKDELESWQTAQAVSSEDVGRLRKSITQTIEFLSTDFTGQMEWQETDLSLLINDISDMVSDFRRPDVEFIQNYDTEISTISADKLKIKEVLLNLVKNAFEAMPVPAEGQAANELRISVRSSDSDHIQIQISDTGTGISPENLSKIFERHFSTKGQEKTERGIGLDIVQRIVEAHAGTIKVESEVGRGTTFTITLPIRRVEPAIEVMPGQASPVEAGQGDAAALGQTDVAVYRERLLAKTTDEPWYPYMRDEISVFTKRSQRPVKFLNPADIDEESDLPYSSALRPEQPASVPPQTYDDIPRVRVNFPEEDIILGAGGYGVVRLGFLEDGRPVALKSYKSSDARAAVLKNYEVAKIVEEAGNLRVHGIFEDNLGFVSLVMDIAPGIEGPFRVKDLINLITFKELREFSIRLEARGKRIDISLSQFHVTRQGHLLIVDHADSVFPVFPSLDNKFSYRFLLKRFLEKLNPGIQKQILNAIAVESFDQMTDADWEEFDRFLDNLPNENTAAEAVQPPGGINLGPAFSNIEIKRDGSGIPFLLTPLQLQQIHIEGLTPVIINIQPMLNLEMFLGLGQEGPEEHKVPELSRR